MQGLHIFADLHDCAPSAYLSSAAALESLCMSLLAKEPDDRPADAREMIKRLRAVEIPPEEAWSDERAASWWKNHRPALSTLDASAATSVSPRTIMPANLDESRGGGGRAPPMPISTANTPTIVG